MNLQTPSQYNINPTTNILTQKSEQDLQQLNNISITESYNQYPSKNQSITNTNKNKTGSNIKLPLMTSSHMPSQSNINRSLSIKNSLPSPNSNPQNSILKIPLDFNPMDEGPLNPITTEKSQKDPPIKNFDNELDNSVEMDHNE